MVDAYTHLTNIDKFVLFKQICIIKKLVKMERFKFFKEIEVEGLSFMEPFYKLSKEKWGNEVGGMGNSFHAQDGDRIELFRSAKIPKTSESISFLIAQGLFLPNVQGLVILEYLDSIQEFLPEDTWIMGCDYTENLYSKRHFGHLLPFLRKTHSFSYEYDWFPYGTKLAADEMILGFKRD